MKRTVCAAILTCAVLLAGTPAQAGIIYDNGNYGMTSSAGSDVEFDSSVANSFVLNAGANTITDIHWWGGYIGSNSPPALDDFTIQIFADDNGIPDDTAALLLDLNAGSVSRTDTGDNFAGGNFDIYEYLVDVSPLALTAGTTYWLSIYNDTTGDTDDNWYWLFASGGSGAFAQSGSPLGESWFADDNVSPLAFTLTNDGVVPEPASLTLLGLGLGSVVWRARRKRS